MEVKAEFFWRNATDGVKEKTYLPIVVLTRVTQGGTLDIGRAYEVPVGSRPKFQSERLEILVFKDFCVLYRCRVNEIKATVLDPQVGNFILTIQTVDQLSVLQ